MRYYYRPDHPKASKHGFVASADLSEAPVAEAKNAPILMDRFYENTFTTDGINIGSRRKHREYMKSRGLTIASDFTHEWAKAAKEREKVRDGSGDFDHKSRREDIERAIYKR